LDVIDEQNRAKLKFSSDFHPQLDGQTKRVNGILNQYLCNYITGDHKDGVTIWVWWNFATTP